MLIEKLQMLDTDAALPIPVPMADIANKLQHSFSFSAINLRIILDTALQMATTDRLDLACEMRPIYHLFPKAYKLFAS